MAGGAEADGGAAKPRKKAAGRGKSKKAAAAAAPAPDAAAAPLPTWGAASAGRGARASGDDEALNPGMLLADLVRAGDAPAGARRGKRKGGGKAAKKPRAGAGEDADAEDAGDFGVMLDLSGDEGDEGAGDTLVQAIGALRAGEEETGEAMLERRRAMQAGAESEFHAGPVGEDVSVEDLLAPLSGPSFGEVKKQLEGLARAEKLADPVPEPKRNREERATQYTDTRREQGKWMPQVQRMVKAAQVVLDPIKPESLAPKDIGALCSTYKPKDDFELEFDALTRAGGTSQEDLQGAQVLPVNPRIRDAIQTKQVARLKALMLREQQTHRRVNKIKSKTYRKVHRHAETKEREALLERLEVENPEMANELKQEYEKKRAKLRLMRQRNARRKWTATMQRFAKGDKNAQKEISKQAQAAHDERMSLRRAIQGKDPDQSEESDAVDLSASDSDEAGGGRRKTMAERTIDKAKKLTLGEIKSLEGGGELPTTGVLGMNFMREAIKRKREAAKAEAKSALKELEELDDTIADRPRGEELSDSDLDAKAPEGRRAKQKEFTPEELAAARKEVDAIWDRTESSMDSTVSGPLTVKGVDAAELPAAGGEAGAGGSSSSRPARKMGRPGRAEAAPDVAVAANPWLDLPVGEASAEFPEAKVAKRETGKGSGASGDGEAANVEAAFLQATAGVPQMAVLGSPPAADVALEQKKKKKRRGKRGANEMEEDAGGVDMAEDVLSALNADSVEAREQRDLVRTAFVEGAQMDDFDAEQEELRRKKEEDAAAASQGLQGWGSWTGAGLKPRPPKGGGKGKTRGKKDGEKPPEKKSRVQILDSNRQKAANAKYFVDKLPYGFNNVAQYELGMKMPSGPEWNTSTTFKNKVKPKYFMKVGAIVPPLEYIKHLPEEQRASALKTWSDPKQPKRLKSKI